MDSAGKRITSKPIRLIDAIHNADCTKMNPPISTSIPTTSSTTTTQTNPSMSQQTITTESSDRSLQKMFSQIMTEMKNHHAENKILVDNLTTRLDDFRRATTLQFEQCVQSWQLADARITKVEDEQDVYATKYLEQSAVNERTFERIKNLEKDMASIRGDLCKLETFHRSTNAFDVSRVVPPVSLSSTKITDNINKTVSFPIQDSQTPYSIPPVNASTFFGSQERLQEAVSDFSGNLKTLHPEKFIEQLDTYFTNVSLSEAQQLISAQRRLSGDAQVWFESLIPSPVIYEEFRKLFRQRYWSSATQRKIRNDVFKPYQYRRYDGLATHAMKWIASAKYLQPPIDPLDLVSTIIQHYPTPMSMALRGRGPKNTNELLSVLTEFEESASFCENNRDDHRQTNNGVRINNDRIHPSNGYRNHQGNNRYNQRQNPQNVNNEPIVNQIDISGNGSEPLP